MTPFGGPNTKKKRLTDSESRYYNQAIPYLCLFHSPFNRAHFYSEGTGHFMICHAVNPHWSRFDTNTKSLRWVIGLENSQECWRRLTRKNFQGITVNDSREFSKNPRTLVRNFARTGLGLIVDPQVKSVEHLTKSISNWAAFCSFSKAPSTKCIKRL